MPLFAAAIFLSAFLIFQVQPVIARYILPWYGGSPAVWSTCVLFFQLGLLGGYAYAHGLVSFLRKRRKLQFCIHLGLLLLSLLFLPITPDDSLKPEGGAASPIAGILTLLATTVGVPYILLSASGPLLQHWFGEVFPGRSPYRLYAISNLGSILGLLTYPFLFEPLLGVTDQTHWWSVSYAVYGLLAIWCGVFFLKRTVRESGAEPLEPASETNTSIGNVTLWIAFAACGSMLMLSLTNQMCQDIAVVPFLWVLPLSLYLLTFVISFDHARWYFRPVAIPLSAIAVGAVTYLINQQFGADEMLFAWQLIIFLGAIFCGCLVCHGEMVRLKPPPAQLTGFYLAVALGGAIGGAFVSLMAPLIFDGYWELHFSLVLLVILASIVILRDLWKTSLRNRILSALASALALAVLSFGLISHIRSSQGGILESARSFYGVLRVYEENILTDDYYRALYHGRISHGRQYMEDQWRDLPTTYYSEDSGIGAAFTLHPARRAEPQRPMRIGAVGLGVGTVATWAANIDEVRFYEINAQVEEIAREHFTYLEDCKGEETVIIADGRIALERELEKFGPGTFDLLVVDAFSGDSIPIHLLTKEAFELYFTHLTSDGILAVHISNLHLDLSDPVRTIAGELGWNCFRVEYDPDYEEYHTYFSDWVLISKDQKLGARLEAAEYYGDWLTLENRTILWTDDYSNLLDVVIW
ncbi:MAG: fused MFS/spermidine synthase [Verrucomicrobiota bacterium]